MEVILIGDAHVSEFHYSHYLGKDAGKANVVKCYQLLDAEEG